MDIVVTPLCPICLNNYSSKYLPRILYPCGHGMCNYCYLKLKEHTAENNEDAVCLCPKCREPIVEAVSNYDLQEITQNVNTDLLGYWSRRLLGVVGLEGQTVHINENVKPLCQTIFTRICFQEDFTVMEGTDQLLWTEEERHKVKALSRSMIRSLLENPIEKEDALNWISVFHLPSSVEKAILWDVNKFYKSKQFLEKMDATWIMDAILT